MSGKVAKKAKRVEQESIDESLNAENPVAFRIRAKALHALVFVKDPVAIERLLRQPSVLSKFVNFLKQLTGNGFSTLAKSDPRGYKYSKKASSRVKGFHYKDSSSLEQRSTTT